MASYQFNPINILDTSNAKSLTEGGSMTLGGGISIGKDALIGGNVSISGTTTSFSDNILLINKNPTQSTDTGIIFQRYTSDIQNNNNYAGIIYSEQNDTFNLGYLVSDADRNYVSIGSLISLNTKDITTGNVNMTGNLYKNGTLYNPGSQWVSVNSDIFYTSGKVMTADLVSTNISGTNLRLSGDLYVGGTLTTVNVTRTNVIDINISTGTINASGLSSLANVTATNASVGVLVASTGITTGNINVTSLATINNATVTTATVATLLTTDVISTNVSAGSVNLSTGITAGSARITNANVTTATVGTLVNTNATVITATVGTLINTNAVSTNVSSGTMNLSTGITAASAQIANIVGTTISAGTILGNISSANIAATAVSAGTLLATIRVSSANLNASTISVGTIVVAGNILSNTHTSISNQGIHLAWNRSNVDGESWIINQKGGGTANSGIRFGRSDTSNNVTELMRIQDSGNVGIGTNNPGTTLDVSGTFRATTSVTSGALYATNVTATNIVGTTISAGTVVGNISSANIAASLITVGTVNAATLVSSANIAASLITTGTLNAATLVSSANIASSIITAGSLVATTITGGNLSLSGNITIGTLLATTRVSSANIAASIISTGTIRITSNLLALGNSNTIGNIFTTGGNVGIATDTPESKLHVNGAITIEGETVSNAQVDSSNLNQTYISFKQNGSNNDWAYLRQIGTQNKYLIALDIHDDGNEPGFCIRSIISASNPDTVNERFRVQANGNVGINTSSPSTTLHVNGDILADNINVGEVGRLDSSNFKTGYGGFNVGYIATSNADGSINTYSSYNSLTRDGLYLRNGWIEVTGSVTANPGGCNYFVTGMNLIQGTSNFGNTAISIKATGSIWSGDKFISTSDLRVKKNRTKLDTNDCLEIINNIEPVTFNFIDTIQYTQNKSYGFIAQEIEKIIPDAIITTSNFIPSIMEVCDVEKIGTNKYKIQLSKELNKNAKKIKMYDIDNKIYEADIEIYDEKKKELIISNEGDLLEQMFIYGEEILDFKTLEKDVIWTITTAAVKELNIKLQQEKQKVAILQEQYQDLLSRISNLESM